MKRRVPMPPRRSPLGWGKPRKALPRGKRIRWRNVARAQREFVRCYHSSDRVEWVRSLPCVVRGCRSRSSENAHIEADGVSRKAGYERIVPACRTHHREMHRGVVTFATKYLLDLAAEAARIQAAWLAEEARRG